MGEEKDRDTGFSFMQEKIKQKPIYQNRLVRQAAWSLACGLLFGLAALGVWAVVLPRLDNQEDEKIIKPIQIPDEAEEEEPDTEEPPVYITETVSMELEDYEKMYRQLMQIGNQAGKSMVDIASLTTDTDWFDEQLIRRNSVSGVLVGDNGIELLILTDYSEIKGADTLTVTFFDHTTAPASLKKYDRNTELAVLGVNLSDIEQSTRDIIVYVDFASASSKTLRSGEPIIAVGSPLGTSGSVLMGNLTSVSQVATLYDGAYNILTTDILKASDGSGVLVDWSGNIVGLLQNRYEVIGQKNTIQAYGISDMKNIIEHLSNNQDIVYMGIVGADVTTAISEAENIPIGVFVSEVAMNSPAIEAGIQPGDIITGMSGQNVTNLKDMTATLLKCSNGQSIQVVCQRPDKGDYQELELSVNLKILD